MALKRTTSKPMRRQNAAKALERIEAELNVIIESSPAANAEWLRHRARWETSIGLKAIINLWEKVK